MSRNLRGRPADLRSEQFADLEPELPAELMGAEHALCDMSALGESPRNPERHRVAVPDIAKRVVADMRGGMVPRHQQVSGRKV